jgi:hypothetical protein
MGKLYNYILVATILMLASSCSVEKRTSITNPPINKPFVYDTKLNITGNITKDEKIRLTNELGNYWDDSIRVKKVSQLGVRTVIKNPAAYDTANLVRSMQYMNEYLYSQGYYSASFFPEIATEFIKNQERKKIAVNIDLGKNITFDTISYVLKDSTLQKLTEEDKKNSLIKLGDPYTKGAISNELDRLVKFLSWASHTRYTQIEDGYLLLLIHSDVRPRLDRPGVDELGQETCHKLCAPEFDLTIRATVQIRCANN